MNRLLLSGLVVTTVALAGLKATSAFFSDSESSPNNLLTSAKLDLKVNGQNNPVGIVNLDDLKPGDDRIVEKHLMSDNLPARVYMHLKDIIASQGGQTKPEEIAENGTPKFDLQNHIIYDLKVAGQTLIASSEGVLLSEAESCWIPLGQIPGNSVDTLVEQSFHLPDSVGNWAQGDEIKFTEDFLAMQLEDPTIPVTGSGRVWNAETKRCVNFVPTPSVVPTPTTTLAPTPTVGPTSTPSPTPIANACVNNLTWISSVIEATQGTKNIGTPITDPARTDISKMLGIADGLFWSIGKTGNTTLAFTSPVSDLSGNDLTFYEITNGFYPTESVTAEVSLDGSTWTNIGSVSGPGSTSVDLNTFGVPSIKYVRLSDNTNFSIHNAEADGYDVDAISAQCTNNQ